MVHALDEIRRVLAPGGIMIDMRPVMDRWPVEVTSARGSRETGRVRDLPPGLEEDAAANGAMAAGEHDGWFVREDQDHFAYAYSWDSPRDMEEWVESEWEDFIELDEETRRATRSAWTLGEADSRVQVKIRMLITRWKKLK